MKRSMLASLAAATALLAGTLVAAPAWADTSDCVARDNWTGTFAGDGAVQAALDAARGGGYSGMEVVAVSGTCTGGVDLSDAGGAQVTIVGSSAGTTLVGTVTPGQNSLTLINLTIDGAIASSFTEPTLINVTIV